jgi:hypothetical protein
MDPAAQGDIAAAELLEASSVQLRTDHGTHSLVPHAFPAVADLLRGVVYASRDSSGTELPAGQSYLVEGKSIDLHSGLTADLEVSRASPSLPQDVTVNGRALTASTELAPGSFLDVAWSPNFEGDGILVRVSGASTALLCSFADSEGYGSVPLVLFEQAGDSPALLSVHRVRDTFEASPGQLSTLRMRFDFAVEGNLATSIQAPSALVEEAP